MKAHTGVYDYYWPDLGAGRLQQKFLKLLRLKTGLEVLSRDHLQGLFKPGQFLPKIENDVVEVQCISEPRPKRPNQYRKEIISYNLLATPFYHFRPINHYPFLMPYQGSLNKTGTNVKRFTRNIFVDTEAEVAGTLSQEEKQLNKICFSMLRIAPVKSPDYQTSGLTKAEIRSMNIAQFTLLFRLWKQAFPLLHHKEHTYHFNTHGMQKVKEKPVKSRLTPFTFNNQKAEICILRKEHPDHYAFTLLTWIDGKTYELPKNFEPSFFVATAEDPDEYYLLNSITDCNLLAFFAETDYKLLVLKLHHDMYFKCFEDQLRKVYRFIERK